MADNSTAEPVMVPVPWGRALADLASHRPGGFKHLIDRIVRSGIGADLGTRNTYATLFDMTAPPKSGKDLARAYVLVLAAGARPADWLLSPGGLPALYGTEKRLRSLLAAGGDAPSRAKGASLILASLGLAAA